GFETRSLTVYVPALSYRCVGVLLVDVFRFPAPALGSPNCQLRVLPIPSDVSLKFTVSGIHPTFGLAVKPTTGGKLMVMVAVVISKPQSLLSIRVMVYVPVSGN